VPVVAPTVAPAFAPATAVTVDTFAGPGFVVVGFAAGVATLVVVAFVVVAGFAVVALAVVTFVAVALVVVVGFVVAGFDVVLVAVAGFVVAGFVVAGFVVAGFVVVDFAVPAVAPATAPAFTPTTGFVAAGLAAATLVDVALVVVALVVVALVVVALVVVALVVGVVVVLVAAWAETPPRATAPMPSPVPTRASVSQRFRAGRTAARRRTVAVIASPRRATRPSGAYSRHAVAQASAVRRICGLTFQADTTERTRSTVPLDAIVAAPDATDAVIGRADAGERPDRGPLPGVRSRAIGPPRVGPGRSQAGRGRRPMRRSADR